jgi:hypothetical protein
MWFVVPVFEAVSASLRPPWVWLEPDAEDPVIADPLPDEHPLRSPATRNPTATHHTMTLSLLAATASVGETPAQAQTFPCRPGGLTDRSRRWRWGRESLLIAVPSPRRRLAADGIGGGGRTRTADRGLMRSWRVLVPTGTYMTGVRSGMRSNHGTTQGFVSPFAGQPSDAHAARFAPNEERLTRPAAARSSGARRPERRDSGECRSRTSQASITRPLKSSAADVKEELLSRAPPG